MVLDAGSYTVSVTDSTNGCSSTAQVVVTEQTNGPTGIEVTLTEPACGDDEPVGSVTLGLIQGGTGPYTTSFGVERDSTTMIFPSLLLGSYPLQIQDANGCLWDTTLQINEALPVEVQLTAQDGGIVLGEGTTLDIQPSGLSVGDYTVYWLVEGVVMDTCINCTSLPISPRNSQSYEVLLETAQGCTAVAFLEVFVSQEVPVFFPNAFSPNEDGTNDTWLPYLGAGIDRLVSLQVFNRWGALVYEAEGEAYLLGWNGIFEGALLPMGTYTYIVELRNINDRQVLRRGEVILVR